LKCKRVVNKIAYSLNASREKPTGFLY